MMSRPRCIAKISLILSFIGLLLTACKEPTQNIVWPPRTHVHDQEAAKIPMLANGIVMRTPRKITWSGPGTFDADGNLTPGPGFQGSTLVSSIGPIERRASLRGEAMVILDTTKKKLIQRADLCLFLGEVLITKDQLLNRGESGYVENRFSVEDFGDNLFIVKLDPSKKHRLCILPDGTVTAGFAGAKIDYQGVVVERKADGWYVGNSKLAVRNSAP
jgi:hypothetical protein